ncbi:MAG: C-GCAxxG-C-C family protein [Kiritimatiellia bacterium]
MSMTHEEKAETAFMRGMNCTQAVVLAFAADFGMDEALAARVACGLGGGVGREREVCGAVSGAAIVLGLRYGEDKAVVYPHVQDFIARFRAACGSIVCRDLLAGVKVTAGGAPEPRTEAYYRKRPCVELVKLSARILDELLK